MTPTTTTNRVYPGLQCSGAEFFNDANQVKLFAEGKIHDFQNIPIAIHRVLLEGISKEPETLAVLEAWHPDSKIKQMEQFVKCRFGGLDYSADIKNLELQDGDYWACPFRGNCKGEGVVCHGLKYQGNSLTHQDITAIKLLVTSITNEALAEKLNMAMGSFNVFKKQLYKKLGNIQTKQEVAIIAMELNIL